MKERTTKLSRNKKKNTKEQKNIKYKTTTTSKVKRKERGRTKTGIQEGSDGDVLTRDLPKQ